MRLHSNCLLFAKMSKKIQRFLSIDALMISLHFCLLLTTSVNTYQLFVSITKKLPNWSTVIIIWPIGCFQIRPTKCCQKRILCIFNTAFLGVYCSTYPLMQVITIEYTPCTRCFFLSRSDAFVRITHLQICTLTQIDLIHSPKIFLRQKYDLQVIPMVAINLHYYGI